MPQQSRRVVKKRYLVAIPVPSLDINGTPLKKSEIEKWVRRTLDQKRVRDSGLSRFLRRGDSMPAGIRTVEIVRDDELKGKERAATAAFRKFFPEAPSLTLYRTSDGRIGFQVAIGLSSGDRKHFNDAYAAVMRTLGEKRGRPRGVRKVQAKLRLTEDVYKALKATADSSHKTLSSVIEDLAYRARIVG